MIKPRVIKPNKELFISLLSLLAIATLPNCSSISKGVAEALLERETKDRRACHIEGPALSGIEQSLLSQTNSNKTTKVLVVHGISRHIPGYSTHFKDQLVNALGLDVASQNYKEIKIQYDLFRNKRGESETIGILRITRHQNTERTRELLFYELTWSQISEAARQNLEFDNSTEYSYRRAAVNQSLKEFFNHAVPDLMVYRGTGKEKINKSVAQAVCWTFSGDWDDLPSEEKSYCDIREPAISKHMLEDDYFFVTHSLGSRITLDTLAYTAEFSKKFGANDLQAKPFFDALKQKEFQVYMLSNQLPLLQLGQNVPASTGDFDNYCIPGGQYYDHRIFKKINMVAFSDPNDILSYPVPPNYSDKHVDSRLCANISNVSINVARVKDAFGVSFANPLDAHSNYWGDERIINIVKEGINRKMSANFVKNACQWTETVR